MGVLLLDLDSAVPICFFCPFGDFPPISSGVSPSVLLLFLGLFVYKEHPRNGAGHNQDLSRKKWEIRSSGQPPPYVKMGLFVLLALVFPSFVVFIASNSDVFPLKLDDRQITHLICVRQKHLLHDFFRGVLVFFIIIRKQQEGGPQPPPPQKSYSKCPRRTQMR